MRLFVSLKLSSNSIQKIEEWRKPLVEEYQDLRWTREDQLHVTLRFFGDRDPDRVISEIKALHLEDCLPVEYTLSGTGHFGNPPSVLWLSGKFSSNVFLMARGLASIPDGDGRSGGGRDFTPHVTIARLKRGGQFPSLIFDRKIAGTGSYINLISSRLTPDGPVYTNLFSI